MSRKGSLSINSDNIFPIIKKWLYSDHDIFIRELVSNASDAITKLKKLSLIGEFEEQEDYKIEVLISSKNKTISFVDNGIGMTEKEVDEYINQIAFSGAKDFLQKYKDKANDDEIIGHFGLGFYSAFMVAKKVVIETLSYKDGEKAVNWQSETGTEYEIKESNKNQRGTKITLYLNEDSYEFSNEYRVREVLEKYSSFMPTSIYLIDEDKKDETINIRKDELKDTDIIVEHIVEEAKTEEKTNEKGEKELVEVSPKKDEYIIKRRPVLINETVPLWVKHPNEISEEEYKDFYKKVFRDYKDPLFWIHLNMDYPFNLKGILYFPKINTEYDNLEGKIKLYNNQVFIDDNIKEVIPEFLMILKGVIDSSDLPLNVSRSALQNDGFVNKVSEYISKKVADKIVGMCKTERETYEKYWEDISAFIKFGFLKDDKFAKKVNDYILFKDITDKYNTLDVYYKKVEDKEEDKKEDVEETKIFYISDIKEQASYIDIFKKSNKNALYLTHNIDTPFISALEYKNKGLKFYRIDSEISNEVLEDLNEDEIKKKEEIENKVKEVLKSENVVVKLSKLEDEEILSMITISEEDRRMKEMFKQYSMAGLDSSMFPMEDKKTLVINTATSLYNKLISEDEKFDEIVKYFYDIALLNSSLLEKERKEDFIKRINKLILEKL